MKWQILGINVHVSGVSHGLSSVETAMVLKPPVGVDECNRILQQLRHLGGKPTDAGIMIVKAKHHAQLVVRLSFDSVNN